MEGGTDDGKGFRWLSEYEKTWEEIEEDDRGRLQASIDEIINKAKRKRLLVRKGNVCLGMMRHLFVILDMSKSMKDADLLKPTKLACVSTILENFIIEYFDQNPISQLGLIATKDKRADKLTELSGNPKSHVNALTKAVSKGPVGEPSLQNSLCVALSGLRHLPSHASREILLIYGSLTSCDPGDIFETIEELKKENIRCSIIGLSAEIKLCKTICSETDGIYSIILDRKHCQDLILDHLRPPEAKSNIEASLVRMGFPQHRSNDYPSVCFCHIDSKNVEGFSSAGYFCPQCRNKYCDLPVDCNVCGLSLVSAPHLARSYQHLFPLPAFEEIQRLEGDPSRSTSICQGCQKICEDMMMYRCSECHEMFCNDCDLFIHETLHTCPGCSSRKNVGEEGSLQVLEGKINPYAAGHFYKMKNLAKIKKHVWKYLNCHILQNNDPPLLILVPNDTEFALVSKYTTISGEIPIRSEVIAVQRGYGILTLSSRIYPGPAV